MKVQRALLAALSIAWACLACPVPCRASVQCGDGVVGANEECDGGPGGLFIDGDPAKDPCTNGSRCYFQFTCCKFNCQFVGTPGAPCQDGNNCSGPDTCDQVGVCHGGPNVANGTPCDDGLFCTGVETCSDGQCSGHTGNPCAETACNQCQEDTDSCFNPRGTPCSDGSVCVTGGACDGAGACVGGEFNSGPCDDGVYCNGADTCSGGACILHAGDPCSGPDGDGNCIESCNEEGHSCNAPDPDGSACDDGVFCDGASDECSAGVCSGTGSVACDDHNSCTTDFCDEDNDSCSSTTLGNSTPCDDGNLCTTGDSCSDGVCVGTPADGTPCDDGNACTTPDLCSAGACVGTPVLMEDLCPWTVVLRENPKRDLTKTGFAISIDGDVCAGTYKLGGKSAIGDDLVSGEDTGENQLLIAPDATIGGNIVSAGGGARAFPGSGDLPYTNPPVGVLAPGALLAKDGGSGFYDLTGTHELAGDCIAARTSYATVTSALDAIPPTMPGIASVKVPAAGSYTIAASMPGGLNVVDVDAGIKASPDAQLVLDGGGDPATVLVVRVAGKFNLKLRSSIVLAGGLTPDHVLIYVKGKGCKISDITIGLGTLLCSPARVKTGRTIAWIGTVYADGKVMKIGDKAALLYSPFDGF